MKTLELTNAKLVNYEKGYCSYLGNPSWYACFANETDSVIGKTAANAQCGYALENFRDGRACNITYHFTRAGNTIIDGITEA